MSFTADLYKAISDDMRKGSIRTAPYASRLITNANGAIAVYAINMITGMKSAHFAVGSTAPKNAFPSWKGIEISLAKFPAYASEQEYVGLTQLPQSADHIFEIVVEDIRISVNDAKSQEEILPAIISTLAKWREFFQSDRDILLSEDRQQGLFGELLFLEESISSIGNVSVVHWAGSDAEPHDFYIASDAVEVKTTSRKAPYSAHISNEYQLDNQDVPGKVYLRFYALRRSNSSGEKLSDIIDRIRQVLSEDPQMLSMFNLKLHKYGYLEEVSEYYGAGYFVRDTYSFAIDEGFPRITKKTLEKGIFDTEYAISIAQCIPFAIDNEGLYSALKGE